MSLEPKKSTPKIHRHLWREAAETLRAIFEDGVYADKAIERAFRHNKKWGARDRRFFAETVYEVVRWWRYYWTVLEKKLQFKEGTSLSCIYQVLGCWWRLQGHDIPDWEEFTDSYGGVSSWKKINTETEKWADDNLTRAERESIPHWLDSLAEKELSERWEPILHSMNRPARVYLRTNGLRTTPDILQKNLREEGIETLEVEGVPGCLVLPERKNVFMTASFKRGEFEVQDGGSQKIAPFLQVEPGMRVVDACAGAGGKSLHLAQLMENRGRLICMDIHERKLGELRKRGRRAGVTMSDVRVIENTKVIKRLHDSADRVLLDVPCSGLGVLRRNPDSKWKLTEERIKELNEIQSDILQRYSLMVKPGGKLVYATCSVLPSENEEQIDQFLSEQKGWELEESLRLDPDRNEFDGFFACRLKRTSN